MDRSFQSLGISAYQHFSTSARRLRQLVSTSVSQVSHAQALADMLKGGGAAVLTS
jgi:hypothetical protein